MRNESLVATVRRIIQQAREDGERERALAPSRSTGYRREFKCSHEALGKIEQLVGED